MPARGSEGTLHPQCGTTCLGTIKEQQVGRQERCPEGEQESLQNLPRHLSLGTTEGKNIQAPGIPKKMKQKETSFVSIAKLWHIAL